MAAIRQSPGSNKQTTTVSDVTSEPISSSVTHQRNRLRLGDWRLRWTKQSYVTTTKQSNYTGGSAPATNSSSLQFKQSRYWAHLSQEERQHHTEPNNWGRQHTEQEEEKETVKRGKINQSTTAMPVYCNKCDSSVERDQKHVSCSTCQLLFHTHCANISDAKYDVLNEKNQCSTN